MIRSDIAFRGFGEAYKIRMSRKTAVLRSRVYRVYTAEHYSIPQHNSIIAPSDVLPTGSMHVSKAKQSTKPYILPSHKQRCRAIVAIELSHHLLARQRTHARHDTLHSMSRC